jgi:sortase A
MKRTICFFLVCVLCMAMTSPAYATDYIFSSGNESLSVFGKPTSNDNPVSPDPMSENTRRNKDAAHMPPPYFYGSGDIPTEQSSFYHDNIRGNSHSTFSSSSNDIAASITLNTAPLYYADGSIGTLYVEKTKKTIKVYAGESLDNLKKGAGHFSMTSAWDGNVGICGHNRGATAYFGFVKDLKAGDRITYTTLYGSRTYEVFSLEQISEYDYSKLGWSVDNVLTLITCVANSPEVRWAAQLREVL